MHQTLTARRADVAVIGSGPAGAACALRLASEGAHVILVDKRDFPRDKVCGEYLNLGSVRELQALGLGDRLEAKAMALHGLRLFAHGEVSSFPITPAAWSIARTVLDENVRAAAITAGARPVTGVVRGLHVDGDGVTVHLRDRDGADRTLEARYAVGADGMHSTVARLLGLTSPTRSKMFGVGGHHPNMPLGAWVEIYSSKHGYLALNPMDSRSANALFVMSRDRLSRASATMHDELAQFSRSLTNGARVVDDVQFDATLRGIGPLSHRTTRPARQRVLLAGDAAAFIDPFTGQGIYLALSGARLAARAVASALANPARERELWREYTQSIAASVRERELVALMMRTLVRWNAATRRAARALQRRPEDFAVLIDAVCAKTPAKPLALAAAVGQVLR
jgi:flavin-dependent dehydrogenase